MVIVDLHVATIADEMREGPRVVVHAIVIDAEDANVFRELGEATCAAEQAIGGNGDATRHEGSSYRVYGQADGQDPPQSIPPSSPF